MKIHQLYEEDLDELAVFLCAIFNSSSSESWKEKFSYYWNKNPAFTKNENKGFVFKEENRIVGFIGKFPTLMQINYHDEITYSGFGLAVNPEYRRNKLASSLREAHYNSGSDHIIFSTTPSPVTRIINNRYGFQYLPRGFQSQHEIISLIPVNMFKFYPLLAYLWASHYRINSRSILIPSLKYKDFFKDKTKYIFTEKVKSSLDFDYLWSKSKTFFKNTNIRTSSVINWYLTPMKYNPQKFLYCCYSNNGELIGYAIFRIKLVLKKNIVLFRLFDCVDFWMDWSRDFPLTSFMGFVAEKSKKLNCDAIVIHHFNRYFSDLIKKDFLPINGPRRNDYFCGPEHLIQSCTYNDSFFSILQGDSLLYSSPL